MTWGSLRIASGGPSAILNRRGPRRPPPRPPPKDRGAPAEPALEHPSQRSTSSAVMASVLGAARIGVDDLGVVADRLGWTLGDLESEGASTAPSEASPKGPGCAGGAGARTSITALYVVCRHGLSPRRRPDRRR